MGGLIFAYRLHSELCWLFCFFVWICYLFLIFACPIGFANEGYMYGVEIYMALARAVVQESFITTPTRVLILSSRSSSKRFVVLLRWSKPDSIYPSVFWALITLAIRLNNDSCFQRVGRCLTYCCPSRRWEWLGQMNGNEVGVESKSG